MGCGGGGGSGGWRQNCRPVSFPAILLARAKYPRHPLPSKNVQSSLATSSSVNGHPLRRGQSRLRRAQIAFPVMASDNGGNFPSAKLRAPVTYFAAAAALLARHVQPRGSVMPARDNRKSGPVLLGAVFCRLKAACPRV